MVREQVPQPPTTIFIQPPEQKIFIVPGPKRRTTPRIVELPPESTPAAQPPIIVSPPQPAPQPAPIVIVSAPQPLPAPYHPPSIAPAPSLAPSVVPSQISWSCARPVPRIAVQSPTLMVAPTPVRPRVKSTHFRNPVAESLPSTSMTSGRRSSMGSTLFEDMIDSMRNKK